MYIANLNRKERNPVCRLAHITILTLTFSVAVETCHADVIAFTPLSDGGTSLGNFNSTFGYDFTVTQSIIITEIGAFDDFSNGFSGGTVGVRFWNISGSATSSLFQVNNGDALDGPFVSGPGFNGRFRYEDIPDFVLVPGTYVVGANFGNSPFIADGFIRDSGSVMTGGSEVILGNARSTTGVNAFPSNVFIGDNLGYFGPNFKYDVTAVPEPSSFAFMAVSGCVFMAIRRRRKQTEVPTAMPVQ